MARSQSTQRQRTQDNPLFLGEFSQLSIRALKGSLGPKNQVVGSRDTALSSNGGFGGGSYNHWFSVKLNLPAWIIVAKGGTRPKYINVSVYDVNLNPIEGRGIFQDDSIVVNNKGDIYNPYVGHVMSAQSDLYNTFDPRRFDKGDERYFPLQAGVYLICVSTTRNEPISYEVSVVLEFETSDFSLLLEDFTFLLFENGDEIGADVTAQFFNQDIHEHSLAEWQTAWEREHQQDDRFPANLIPLATRP
jgi:hypothetical protein